MTRVRENFNTLDDSWARVREAEETLRTLLDRTDLPIRPFKYVDPVLRAIIERDKAMGVPAVHVAQQGCEANARVSVDGILSPEPIGRKRVILPFTRRHV